MSRYARFVAICLVRSRISCSLARPLIRFSPALSSSLPLKRGDFGVGRQARPDFVGDHVAARAGVAHNADMREHPDQRVLARLVQDGVLEVVLDLLVDICIVKRGPLGIVAHHLVADRIGRVACGR